MIDIRTIIVSYVTTNLVCASIMASLWLQNRKHFAGIGFWFGNYVAICLGFVLFALRGVAPDFLSIVIANAAIVYGMLSLYMGLQRFVGKAGSQTHNYVLLAIFVLVHIYFTHLHPSLLARNINVSVALFVFAFQIVWFVFRRLDTASSSSLRNLGVIAALICLISIVRVVTDLIVDPGADFLTASSDSIVILVYQILQIAVALSLFLQVNRRLVVGLERDITERKRAQEALQQTQVQVIEQQRAVAILEERERLARELHDGIGQILGYVNIQAQAAQSLLEKNHIDAAQKNLEDMVQAVQDVHNNLRRYILGLHDSSAPQRDFYQALQVYLNSFYQAWGIETVFSPPQDELPALPATVEDQLLHIVQEALINIRKHARARRVEVLITLQAGEMAVIISDDGQGFDLQGALGGAEKHFGLSIMRERAEQVGGRLEIRSTLGRGTQVFAHIPYSLKPSSEKNTKDMYGLRILLADDQPLFLDGMRNLLKARGLTVVGVARDGLEACEQVKTLRPDVVLMDVQMPKCDGIEATRRIKAEFPEIKVVLLTVSENDEDLLDAIKYGASSYLLKNLDAGQLFSTLDGLARDEIQIAPELAARLLKEFNRAGDAVRSATDPDETFPAELTLRQWEVLRLVARGLTYKEAGSELHLTEPAIKYHMAQILERLQLKNREQAVAYLHQVQEARKRKDIPTHD